MRFSQPLTLLFCSTLTVMAAATITPALPAIAAHFAGTQHAELLTRLVLTLPALFIVLGAPLAGHLCDRVGRIPVLWAGLGFYVLAGAAGTAMHSLPLLLATRAALGVGIALLMTATTSMIADSSSGARQARLLGLQGAFMAGGGVVFVLLGGLAAELSWRAPFLVYLLALLLLPSVRALPETRDVQSRHVGSGAPPGGVLGLYLLAVLGMALFYLVPVFLPFLLGDRFAASAAWVGGAVALVNLAAMVSGTQFGRVRGRVPAVAMVGITCACMALGYAVIALAGSAAWLVPGLIIAGIGLGFMVPNLSHWTVQRVDERQRGRALGWLTMAFFLGQFTSPLLAQPVVAVLGGGGLFLAAAGVLGGGALVALVTAVVQLRRARRAGL